MIGRLHHVVIDCPDPAALAAFYSELLGLPVTYRSAGWVVVARDDTTSGLAFQRAPDHQPPARPRVLALGARGLPGGEHVYADPAGHPFCLISRPRWAPPIGAGSGGDG